MRMEELVMGDRTRNRKNIRPKFFASDGPGGRGFDLNGHFGRHAPVSMQPIPHVRLFYAAPASERTLTPSDLDSLLNERIHASKI